MTRIVLILLIIGLLAGPLLATVTVTTSSVGYTCDGATVAFPYTFPTATNTDLVVRLKTIATGATTTLTLTTHYSATVGSTGGTVTTVATYSSAYELWIERVTPLQQILSLTVGGVFNPTVITASLDKIHKILIELNNKQNLALRAPPTETASSMQIPNAVDRASHYLAFDTSGNPIASDGTTPIPTISTYGSTLIDDATAAAALTTLGVSAYAQTILDDADAGLARVTLDTQKRTWIDVTDHPYHATGNGTTDDTAAVQAAATACPSGGTLYFPSGNTFLLTTAVNIASDIKIRGGGTIKSNGGYLNFTGAISKAKAITVDVARGSAQVSVASGDEAAFTAGDLVLLYSQAKWSEGLVQQGPAELHTVRGTADGMVQFDDFVQLRYDVNEPADPAAGTFGYDQYQDPNVALYAPISVDIEGITFQLAGNSAKAALFKYCRPVRVLNCRFIESAARTSSAYVVLYDQCQDVLVQGCYQSFQDSNAKGPEFTACQGVRFVNNDWFDNGARPAYWFFCIDVSCLGNHLTKNDGYCMTFESCYKVVAQANQITGVPDSYADFGTSATSRSGIMLVGSEAVQIVGNSFVDCYGESGSVYLRSANYAYADTTNYTAEVPECMWLGLSDVTIADNYVLQTNAGLSSALLYGKSYGRGTKIVNNTFVAGSPTQLEITGISLRGDYNDVEIAGNTIRTKGIGIYLSDGITPLTTTTWYPDHVNIHDNVYDANGSDEPAFAFYIGDDTTYRIERNRVNSVGHSDTDYMINVGRFESGAWGNTILQIRDNIVTTTNSAGATRGISLTNFTGVPTTAGNVVISGNEFRMGGGGISYDTSIAAIYCLEQVTTFTDNDTTPDTYGLSKLFKVTNTNPTSITDFLQPRTGQVIYVFATNANTTIVDGSGIELFSNANLALAADQVVGFIYDGTDWNQFGGGATTSGASFTFTDENVSPNATGMLKYDDIVAGFSNGLLAWYDGATIRYLVDLPAANIPGDAQDDYVVAYDKDTDSFYMKIDETGGAGVITSVWTDVAGDVSALTAAAGDTLDATSADSTVPWKVNAAAAPTVEGQAIWESDTDELHIGDGAGTLTVAMTRDKLSVFAATSSAELYGVLSDETGTGGAVFANSPTFVDDITVAAAGVLLTGSNGSLTILGLGDGQDEDIKLDLNTTANTLTITSPTKGLDKIDATGITITATGFVGALTGNASGTAATVTGAAQAAITSVGTLTGLTMAGIIADNDDMVFEADADNNGTNKFSFTDGASTEIYSISEAGSLDWVNGNVIYVPLAGDIHAYIDAAVEGDTLILSSGEYVITATIPVDKHLNIVGQGEAGLLTAPTVGHGTLISSTTAAVVAFTVTESNVRLSGMSINLTGAGSTGITVANNLSGEVFTNLDIIVNGTGAEQGIVITGSNAVLRDIAFYCTSSDDGAAGLVVQNNSSTTQNAVVDCFGVTGTTSGNGASYSWCAICNNNNDDNTLTLNLSNSVFKSLSGSNTDVAIATYSTTTFNATINAYMCTLDGADYDVLNTATNTLNVGGSVLVNNKKSGTITYRTIMAAAGVAIGAAGDVVLTTDADGMFIMTSAAGGQNEDLRWNLDDTADTVTVTSGTGVTLLNFSGVNLQATTFTGNVTGNVSGTAATVTGAAQASITSLGTLTTLTVDNITLNGNTISSDAASTLAINPTAGQAITFDSVITIDAGLLGAVQQLTLSAQADPVTDADGEIALDTDGWGAGYDALEFFNGTASTYIVATTASDTPTNGQVPKWNTGGTITWENDNDSAGATAWDDIGDPDADATIAFGDFEQTITSSMDILNHAVLTIDNTHAAIDNATTLLNLKFTGDATPTSDHVYLGMYNYGAAADYVFTATQFSSYNPEINYAVNAAGGSLDWFTVSQTVAAMNSADDLLRGFYVGWTNADHAAGTMVAFDAGAITGDAETTEYGLRIGAGYDISASLNTVELTGDGDGALTIKGNGNNADEDLVINFDDTPDTVTVTSTTGAALINFSGIDLQAAEFIGPLTGNVTGNASGTSASFTGNLTGDVTSVAMATTIAADAVHDSMIDWGTGAGQVDVTDVENGAVNILLETEIDASSELAAIMDDETGTGPLVFGTSPTLNTSLLLTSVATEAVSATLRRCKDSTAGPFYLAELARNNEAAPAVVASGDVVGGYYGAGYSAAASGYIDLAGIRMAVDGTPDSGGDTTDMPGRLEFLTVPDGSATAVLRMAIDNAGNIKMGDGTWTNYVQVSAAGAMTFAGTASVALPTRTAGQNNHYRFTILNPHAAYAKDTHICIDPKIQANITITNIEVTCDDDPDAEPEIDLCYADAFIGLAGSAVIHALDTTAGAFSSGAETLAVASGHCIYVILNTEPEEGMTQISVNITWDYD